MWRTAIRFFCLNIFFAYSALYENDVFQMKDFIAWPNGTVPFYINPDHFDHEQSLSIMTSLTMFAFKSCLKFSPVLVKPEAQHVLVIENPSGIRKCVINTDGHSIDEPHIITLGYDCLKSPQIEMIIMKALGFPFEHNRAIRDLYIEVLTENVEPGSMELFTQDPKQFAEMRTIPYDVNSVMHFGERDFSKNGHRTIIFKDHKTKQHRDSLTSSDIRKIELVYGPECRKRDRQEKVELCQNYPGVVRRKRDTDLDSTRSLRVNRDISPPPTELTSNKNVTSILTELGIGDKIDDIIESVHKISSIALQNARNKYCNNSKPGLRTVDDSTPKNNADILGIVELVAEYAKSLVDHAIANITAFCESSDDISKYQRARCAFYEGGRGCPMSYRSTKSGLPKYSTQHRPYIVQSTKHTGNPYYPKQYALRTLDNETETESTTANVRRKRSLDNKDKKLDVIVITNVSTTRIEPETKLTTILKENTNRATGSKGNHGTGHKARRNRDSSDSNEDSAIEKSTKGQFTIEIKKNKKSKAHESYDIDKKRRIKIIRNVNKKDETLLKKEINKSDRLEANSVRYKEEEPKKITRTVPKTVPLSAKNKEFYKERRWPDGILRYILKDNKTFDLDDARRRLDEVSSILRKKTCVRMQEITESDTERFEDYLVLDNSPDYVTGRVGGRQPFGVGELFQGGQHRQHAAMMVMAMLGFYFEVSRHDRDKYIRVHMRHVRPDKLHHFEKIRDDATLELPYDYRSATHPAWQFWRKVGKTGISTVATFKENDPDGSLMKALGQNDELLSDLDIVKINSVYGVRCFKHTSEKELDNK